MTPVKAVIFDFIGTLASVKGYSLEASKKKLAKAIAQAGFNVTERRFLEAYSQAHEKYRVIRYEKLVEVTNAVWISDALNILGYKTEPDDPRIRTGVNVFFEDYLKSLRLRPCVTTMLKKTFADHKLGLVSNFTYAPVIYAALRKLAIDGYFNAVLVSEEVGYRKPSPRIFKEALKRLGVTAEETVYVGDSPTEDIGGARAAGMKTAFVPSQFNTLENLIEAEQKSDLTAEDTCDLCGKLPTLLK